MSESEVGEAGDRAKAADDAQVAKEKQQQPISQPGGFKNDPDDPTNPNESIERARRQVRP